MVDAHAHILLSIQSVITKIFAKVHSWLESALSPARVHPKYFYGVSYTHYIASVSTHQQKCKSVHKNISFHWIACRGTLSLSDHAEELLIATPLKNFLFLSIDIHRCHLPPSCRCSTAQGGLVTKVWVRYVIAI